MGQSVVNFKFMMRFLPVIIFLLLAPAPQATAQSPAHTLDDDMLYRINFGSAEDVRVLLEKGANPNARNKQGETPLEIAIERNDSESSGIAMALIEKGADIDARDKNGNPPIIDAIRYKQFRVVKELLSRGVDFHTKSSDGIALIDYAKVDGDPETVKMIQDLIDKENAYAASLRDPNRFKDIVQIYTMDSCLYQYWSYFYSSRQAPEKDIETKKKIDGVKKAITDLITQIQQYYSSASTTALHNASSRAVQTIYEILNRMVSNRNRAENGVGTEEDAKTRCGKVVDNLHIEFVPAVLSNSTSGAPAQGAPSTPKNGAPPPLPMEPGH
jgi:ankyrin repeat protein